MYSEYNKQLRTWLVAFGIGVPAALLINEDLRSSIPSHELKSIIIAFVIGAVVQIFIAFINKYANWFSEHGSQVAKDRADWLLRAICIDIVLDVGSFIAFGLGVLWSVQAIFDPCIKP